VGECLGINVEEPHVQRSPKPISSSELITSDRFRRSSSAVCVLCSHAASRRDLEAEPGTTDDRRASGIIIG